MAVDPAAVRAAAIAAVKAKLLAEYGGAKDDTAEQWAKCTAEAAVEGALGAEAGIVVGDPTAIHTDGAGEINGITSKTTPAAADPFLIEDSAAANVKKKLTYQNLLSAISAAITHLDPNAIHKNVAAEISTITAKTTPAASDLFLMEDSAASNAKKRITWANILAAVLGSVPTPTKKIMYAAQYPSTGSNASSIYTYWVGLVGYCYFYANVTYSTEAVRQLPIPGPGVVRRVFARTSAGYANTKTTDTLIQLRKNGADVSGASFSIPGTAPPETMYDVTGSWPYNDGDMMCLRADVTSTGNLYMHDVGIIVEV